MLQFILDNWQSIALAATGVVTGASVALKAIAPLTDTTKDDRVARFLVKVVKVLKKVALNTDRGPKS